MIKKQANLENLPQYGLECGNRCVEKDIAESEKDIAESLISQRRKVETIH